MPNEPVWLTPDHAIEFNRLAVESTGEPFHVREPGLLESALASPRNHWHYDGQHDVAALAAQLLLAVARDHPFAQGNKRTALLLADAFLTVNGYRLIYPDEELAELIIGAVDRTIPDEDFVRQFSGSVGMVSPTLRRRKEQRVRRHPRTRRKK